MFGIDVYTLETVIASLIGVAMMAGTMTWAFFKVRKLMNEN